MFFIDYACNSCTCVYHCSHHRSKRSILYIFTWRLLIAASPLGATLKQIRDQTGVRVDIPKRDSFAAPNGNGHANGSLSGKVSPAQDDEDEEPTVPVTLVGPEPLAYEAQASLKQIIASRTSKSTSRVRDIPPHVLPFIIARRQVFLAAAQEGQVNLALKAAIREITVTGDREAVARVVETIKSTVEHFKTSLTPVKIALPKRQHRLLVGKAVEEIMARSNCAVTVAGEDQPGDDVTVWGQSSDLPGGLSAVMERANSQYIHEYPLPGPIGVSLQLVTYLYRVNYVNTLVTAQPGVSVFLPSLEAAQTAQSISVDLVGDKPAVDAVVKQISELLGKLIGATRNVTVDWLLHRVVTGKNAKK